MENKTTYIVVIIAVVIVTLLFFLLNNRNKDVAENPNDIEESAVETDSLGGEIFTGVGGSVSSDAVPQTNPFNKTETNPFNDIKNPFDE